MSATGYAVTLAAPPSTGRPLAAELELVRRELAALERDPAPATEAARYGAERLLRRAAEAVASARSAAARREL